ncbi:MAG TPA: hypothetical protein VD948_05615, partial [Rhodothermales bacterium]|nr:hypothetical protein [Rhodothermales bacterium]
MNRLPTLGGLLVLVLALAGCEQVDRLRHAVMPRGDLQAALEAEAPRSEISAVRAFYQARNYEPLWVDDRGLAPQGDSLLQRLCQAATEGLRPEDYNFTRLDAAHERLAGGAKDSSSAAALAALDVALSEAYLEYASDLSRGRVPLDRLGGIWKLQRSDSLDARATLDRVAEVGLEASVDSLFGAHSGYSNLRDALARYRRLYAQGGWGTVASARDRAGLIRRLRVTGELTDSTEAGLSAAV